MDFRAICVAGVVALSVVPLLSGAAISPALPGNPPNLFSPPAAIRPLKIGIYTGPGTGEQSVAKVTQRARQLPGAKVTPLTPAEVGTRDLAEFDIIVFAGGGGSAQAKAIGETGRKNVRTFVENGGGYLGICAGAYLACAGFNWGLGILNAKTVSQKWQRGRGMMQIELTDEGRALFGSVNGPFAIRYNNGPIIKPLDREGLPP